MPNNNIDFAGNYINDGPIDLSKKDDNETFEEFLARNLARWLHYNEDPEMTTIFETVNEFISTSPTLEKLDGVEYKKCVLIFWKAIDKEYNFTLRFMGPETANAVENWFWEIDELVNNIQEDNQQVFDDELYTKERWATFNKIMAHHVGGEIADRITNHNDAIAQQYFVHILAHIGYKVAQAMN